MVQMNVNRNCSIEEMRDRLPGQNRAGVRNETSLGQSFAEILMQKQEMGRTQELKFSKHANERLQSRQIDLSHLQRERLEDAVRKAEAKGIKDSLVMLDNMAFIVNVKNNTVITAIAGDEERIFSNIDGAVIA